MTLIRFPYRHKNNKFKYYSTNYLRQFIPDSYFRRKLPAILNRIEKFDRKYIDERVDYYNKLSAETGLGDQSIALKDFLLKDHLKTYYFDLYEYSRYFDRNLKINPLFGDITYVPGVPSLTKSRPITPENGNSVIMKLNKVRHFMFVQKDKRDFSAKKNMLVSRGKVFPSHNHRIRFLEMYHGHPLCDAGMINRNELPAEWVVEKMSIEEQLEYKFILCLEGNDVASNLKWVMSSNSLAVMPRPKYETWFMEGTLVPGVHFVAIADDYSDLEEKLDYYIKHPGEAQNILHHAHEFVAQFLNKEREDLISLLVLKKYFEKTGQL